MRTWRAELGGRELPLLAGDCIAWSHAGDFAVGWANVSSMARAAGSATATADAAVPAEVSSVTLGEYAGAQALGIRIPLSLGAVNKKRNFAIRLAFTAALANPRLDPFRCWEAAPPGRQPLDCGPVRN